MFQENGAGRLDARFAPKNNAFSGSKTSPRPSLIGGGGTNIKQTVKVKFDSPPTIKREKSDFCRERSCGSPWTLHLDPIALKMHIKSWFAYGKYGSVVNTYGPDICHEVIKAYKAVYLDYEQKGLKINSPGGLFHTKLQEILADGEPVEDPAAVARAWADYAETEKRSKKKKREDSERDKFRQDYEKVMRRGK